MLAFTAALLVGACGSRTQHVDRAAVRATSAALGGARVTAVIAGDVLLVFQDDRERAALWSATTRVTQDRAALAALRVGPKPQDLARAAAQVAQRLTEYQRAANGPQQAAAAESRFRQALAQLADAQAEANRMRALFARGYISAQQRDAAVARETTSRRTEVAAQRAALRAAQAQAANVTPASAFAAYRDAQERYRSLAAGPRPDTVRAVEANLRAAEHDVATSRLHLEQTIGHEPPNGVDSALDLHPGARITVSAASLRGERFAGVVERVDVGTFAVEVRVHDSRRHLHAGTPVAVTAP